MLMHDFGENFGEQVSDPVALLQYCHESIDLVTIMRKAVMKSHQQLPQILALPAYRLLQPTRSKWGPHH